MKIVKTILVLLSINIGHQQFSINLQSETNWCGPWSFHSNSVFSLSYIGVPNAPTVCERVLRVTCIVAFTFCSQNQTHSRIRNEDKHAFEQMFTFVEFLRMRLINWLEWARAQFHFFLFFTSVVVSAAHAAHASTLRCTRLTTETAAFYFVSFTSTGR